MSIMLAGKNPLVHVSVLKNCHLPSDGEMVVHCGYTVLEAENFCEVSSSFCDIRGEYSSMGILGMAAASSGAKTRTVKGSRAISKKRAQIESWTGRATLRLGLQLLSLKYVVRALCVASAKVGGCCVGREQRVGRRLSLELGR